MKCKPFLRWCGGKTNLLPKILPHVPTAIDTYYEPFLGGGSLFFALASEEPRRFKHAVLSDANEELANCYRQVRDNVEDIIAALNGEVVTQERFRQIVAMVPINMGRIDRAARFLYLNRVGFNGLWRVNAAGEYNVPFGRRADGKPIVMCPPDYAENLRACSRALQGVEIKRATLHELLSYEDQNLPGDFWFFDPPYVPAKADSFTAYTSIGFGIRQHVRLVSIFEDRRGGAILCNADTAVSRDIYRGLKTIKVSARRSVSGKAKGRKPAREILVVAP